MSEIPEWSPLPPGERQSAGEAASSPDSQGEDTPKTPFGFRADPGDKPAHAAETGQDPGLPGGFGFKEPGVIARAAAEARSARESGQAAKGEIEPIQPEPEAEVTTTSDGEGTTERVGFIPPIPFAAPSASAAPAADAQAAEATAKSAPSPSVSQRPDGKSAQSFGFGEGNEAPSRGSDPSAAQYRAPLAFAPDRGFDAGFDAGVQAPSAPPRESGFNPARHRAPLAFAPDRGFDTGFQAPSAPPRGIQLLPEDSWSIPTQTISRPYGRGAVDMKGLDAAASGLPLSVPRTVGAGRGKAPAPLRAGDSPQPAVQSPDRPRNSGVETTVEQSL